MYQFHFSTSNHYLLIITIYRRLNACRPDIENSAFAHDFFDHFDWGAMAYRRYPHVPYVPNKHNSDESGFQDDGLAEILSAKQDVYTGDDSIFKDF